MISNPGNSGPGLDMSNFLCLSLSRSRAPEQAKMQTDGSQTRADTRLRALNAQEGSREQREKNAGMRAWNGDFGRGVLKRPRRETAPTLAFRAEKSPTDKGWALSKWWSWRELNPRPQAFVGQIYMFSVLFWISPPPPRRRTLRRQPVPLNLAPCQGTRHKAS